MPLDIEPTAASTYARTLIGRGCPRHLAQAAAEILAVDGNRSATDQKIIDEAWAAVSK